MVLRLASKRLISLCFATLLSVPVMAVAPNHPVIGTIVQSSGATLSGIAVPSQGTLVTDAVLNTASGGSAWVRFSPDLQAGLSEETSVSFDNADGYISAHLSSGTVAAKSSGKQELVVDTRGFRIEPAQGKAQGKAVYVVALLPDNTTIVSARRGNVAVTETSSGKKHLVPEGHYAKISSAPAATPGQAGAAAAASPGLLNSTPVLFAIGLGSGLGVGFGVAEGPLGLSPASPSAP